jgi:hypothetical protein
MIAAIVRFALPPRTSLDTAKSMFEMFAPNYKGAPG